MIEEVTAGIDWLTETLPVSSPTGDLWIEHSLGVLDLIAKEGYELYERTMQGYYGISAGNCFVGSRDDTHIVQMSGYHANDHFEAIYRPDGHVSRIDVQLTARFDIMPLMVAKEAYNDSLSFSEGISGKARRKCVLISGSDGGDTCYIGSRSSEQFGRIYNKERQSDDPAYERTWRYEVVFRNDLAGQVARQCPLSTGARAQWATSVVSSWFSVRGVDISGLDTGGRASLPLTRTLPTDVQRQLTWIEHQASPTIRRLIEGGYGDRIRELLGIE